MRDKAESGNSWLQYDEEGNPVARLEKTPSGKWLLIPEPGYPFVIEIATGRLLLWNRETGKAVKFAKDRK